MGRNCGAPKAPEPEPREPLDDQEAAEGLRLGLRRAVERQLISDRPVGLFAFLEERLYGVIERSVQLPQLTGPRSEEAAPDPT